MQERHRLSAPEEKARYLQHNNSLEIVGYLSHLRKLADPVAARVKAGARGLDYGAGPVEGMQKILPQFLVDAYDPIFFPREDLLNFRYVFLLCSEAAEHFYRPAEEFARMDAALNPGAWIGVSSRLRVPSLDFERWHYRRDPSHVCFYGETTVKWIARRFGWRLESLASPIWIFQKEG